jgi:hypothetical protein
MPLRTALLTAAIIAPLAGCDITGEYDRRFAEALQQSGERAVFDQQLFPTETEVMGPENMATGVKLRIPKLFDAESKSLAAEPRAQPPFLRIPGFGYALERALDDPAGQFAPAYIYFGAVPKADQKLSDVQGAIVGPVAAAFPGAAWADASFRTPQGASVSFKVIRGEGQQAFDSTATGGVVANLDGKFELYLIDAPTHTAIVAFRAPKAQAQKYQLDAAIQAAMGTVVVPSAPAGDAGAAPPMGAPAPSAPPPAA